MIGQQKLCVKNTVLGIVGEFSSEGDSIPSNVVREVKRIYR